MRLLLLFGLLVLVMSAAAQSKWSFQGALAPDIQQYFLAQQQGWLGADVGTSVPLQNNTYLWIWGDTVVGKLLPNNTRSMYAMPRNSISIVDMNATPVTNTHYMRYVADSETIGFWTPEVPTRWFWATAAASVDNAVYVFASQLWQNGTGQWAFVQDYSVLISIPDSTGDPYSWASSQQRVPLSSTTVSWSNAAVAAPDGFVYILGYNSTASSFTSYNTLARISTAALKEADLTQMQFLYAGGVWKSAQAGVPLAPLFDGPAVMETTLTWHAGMQCWYLQYLPFMGTQLLMRTAPALTGPWSAPTPVFSLPAPYTVPGAFCYAVKSHPEWAEGSWQLVFSFVCNAPVDMMLTDLALYVPVFVRVNITPQ